MLDPAIIISNSTICSRCSILADCSGIPELLAHGITVAGEAELGTPYEMRRAAGTEALHTTVWFLLEGTIDYAIPGKQLTAGPGMVVVQSSATNRLCTANCGKFRHLYFHMPQRNLNTTCFRATYAQELQNLLRMLQREAYATEAGAERRGMLAALLSSYLEAELSCAPEPLRIRSMIALIEQAPGTNWTTALLAKRMNLSCSLLYQLCTRHYGASPGELIRRTKFRYATALLRQSGKTLDEIARLLGYSTAYAFSKAFYKTTGRRPGEVQRRGMGPSAD